MRLSFIFYVEFRIILGYFGATAEAMMVGLQQAALQQQQQNAAKEEEPRSFLMKRGVSWHILAATLHLEDHPQWVSS